MKTTEMRDKIIEEEYTDYVEKKVRKKTTETPHAIQNWMDKVRDDSGSLTRVRASSPAVTTGNTFTVSQYSTGSRMSLSPARKSVTVKRVSPARSSKASLRPSTTSSITLAGRELENFYKKEEIARAKPELDAAREAIWNLDKSTIAEMKSYKAPPRGVMMVMEAVLILLGVAEQDWASAKRLMADANFKEKLRYVNPEAIPIKVVKHLKKEFLNNPSFTPKAISQISVAAGVMCLWVRAIVTYADILIDI